MSSYLPQLINRVNTFNQAHDVEDQSEAHRCNHGDCYSYSVRDATILKVFP